MANKILVVDDSLSDIIMIKSMLSGYELVEAHDGIEAYEVLKNVPDIDLMLLDLHMPRLDGFGLLEKINESKNFNRVVTVILTNHDEIENEIRGLELGASDYIRKPLNISSLLKRIEVHINLRKARLELEENNAELEEIVARRTREMMLTRDITIRALTGLLEIRNIESGNHTQRTQTTMHAFCRHLQKKDKYRDSLTDSFVQELYQTAPLHDIGKVGIPDSILLKPGKLTPDEFEVMKRHTTYGVNALMSNTTVAVSLSFIRTAIQIIEAHHEWYDGSGYPHGLKGENIPLPGRIMAIIDVYDALVSKRVYKPAFFHEQALRMLNEERGTHFDPDLLDNFFEIADEIMAITKRFVPY